MKNIIVFSLLLINSSLLIPCNAQYTVLHTFSDSNGSPTGDVTLVGNKLYGMTNVGELSPPYCGSIFAMDTNGSNYRILHEFDSTNGFQPHFGSLTYSFGILYGTTTQGGTHGWGFIFSIDTNGNNYKDMFDFDGIHGALPCGSLTLTGGKLYGMAYRGGGNNWGCIYSIDTNGSSIEDVYDFIGGNMGSEPFGALTISGGKMYGMTSEDGNGGNVFSIDTNGDEYEALHGFNNINNGDPYGSLILSKGVLYGMTTDIAPYPIGNGFGNIFSIDTNGNNYKDMLDFNGKKGKHPYGSLILSPNGILYGMSINNIFSIDTNGNRFRQLFTFNGTGPDGYGPTGSLTLSGNVLYGMTEGGGTNGYGVIFKIDTNAISTAAVNDLSANNSSINIYPNPALQMATLQLSLPESEDVQVSVINLLGEIVFTTSYKGEQGIFQQQIPLSSLPAATYIIKAQTKGNVYYNKILKLQ